MGVRISDWRLAGAVSCCGQLGVVSGVGLDTLVVRRLEDGDPGGHMRRAISHFPITHALPALERYLRRRRREPGEPYTLLPLYKLAAGTARQQMSMLGAFVEVWLAKAGHDGLVGINLLTKIQPTTLPTFYGAMLAGVDYVLMGAGVPREISAALDLLALHQPAQLRLDSPVPWRATRRGCASIRGITGSSCPRPWRGRSSSRSSRARCWPACW